MTWEEYETIRKRVFAASYKHDIQLTDIEDIIQDIALDVMTNDVPTEDYSTVISLHLGKFRQRRKREQDRMVRLI